MPSRLDHFREVRYVRVPTFPWGRCGMTPLLSEKDGISLLDYLRHVSLEHREVGMSCAGKAAVITTVDQDDPTDLRKFFEE